MEKVVPRGTGNCSGLCAAWYDGSFLFVLFRLSSGADGHVSGTVDYDIFGEPVTETGVFAANSTIVFAYAGKPYDSVTGLSDYGFRDYAPTLARFTTVDPIRDGSNWYAYCNSDPVNYVDMWGLVDVTCTQVNDVSNQLDTCFTSSNPLGAFVDMDKLTEAILNNMDKLDSETMKLFGKMSRNDAKSVIESLFQQVTVHSGLYNSGDANKALGNVYNGLTIGTGTSDVYGLTLGINIYMAGGVLDPKIISDEDIELLGHEFIHVLQGAAQKFDKFLSDYTDTTKYQYDSTNIYEVAAYWFGGALFDTFITAINGDQILGTDTGIGQVNIRK